jgi:small subunit ribosomal protein S1
MPNSVPEHDNGADTDVSFAEVLSEYEQSHSTAGTGGKQIVATVVAVAADSVFLDIGFKTEGILALASFAPDESVKVGDKLPVSVKGRDREGYYELSRSKVARPKDWSALERAFAEKEPIIGTVTAVVKGGLSVDVGVRAFLPASRSGTRDAAEMEKLVGQDIRCRITKLDVADENIVVDRRVIAEDDERVAKERRYSELKESDTVSGIVRSLTGYGAFVDIGGIDGLIHVSDMAWNRVEPADVLSVGQHVQAKVLKVDAEKRRISLGLKQLQQNPWDSAAEKYKIGERVRGRVSRVVDFGAFVELEPGIEGLIHISEMSWAKKLISPAGIVKAGEMVEAVVLAVHAAERRFSLGLKQALGDPWSDVAQRCPVGSVVEGKINSLTNFGAFIQISEGVDGMVHVSDISAEKRINHPREALKLGQLVKAQVLGIDKEKRQMRLGMKQLAPTSLDEFVAGHKTGDVVTGRIVEIADEGATVELGEGIQGMCPLRHATAAHPPKREAQTDLTSLTSMLAARWKGGSSAASEPEPARPGQIRRFCITRVDPLTKRIELEPA